MMLQDAHKAFEAMSAAVSAIKDERWSDALSALQKVGELNASLVKRIGEKQSELRAKKPDRST